MREFLYENKSKPDNRGMELSLVCETREVEVLESHEQGADTSRAHSSVIEVCERNVSAKYQREG